jgi:hypothetical protein
MVAAGLAFLVAATGYAQEATNTPAADSPAPAATDNTGKRPAAVKPPTGARVQRPKAAAATPPVAKTVEGYEAVAVPANIAPTAATQPGPVQVVGQPRRTEGHPCTLWDKEDIAHYKEMLKTSTVMQEEFAKLKDAMDKRIAQPLGVPEAVQDADGKWKFPGDGAQFKDRAYYREQDANAGAISDLGTMYALTGDEKYGEFCRRMLVAYAKGYPRYGHPKWRGADWTERCYRSAFDGRLTGQFLADGGWLIQVARGYDLVYNLPSWTDEERRMVREDLFEGIAATFTADIIGVPSYLDATHNRSAICNAGVLMAGYASDSQKLINLGLYGKGGTKEKPTGGVFGAHFTTQCISTDGLWNEGAMGYQAMARCALVNDAETLWHHGIDMYRYDNGILKRLFDSPLQFAYPDLSLPSTHDSARGEVVPTQNWNDDGPHTYEYAYLRYRDPRYLVPVTRLHLSLRMSVHQGPTSVLFDQDLSAKPALTSTDSVNFTDVGYGILRFGGASPVSLLLEYGPSRSHNHPDKLAIDLFALGDVVVPDPGSVFPYNYPLDKSWYHVAAGHATLIVDEKDQIFFGNQYQFRQFPAPVAMQTVYAPAATLAMQRAWSNTLYPGVTLDRALFVTPQYVADLFGAFAAEEHKYDLAWPLRGEFTAPPADLKFEPLKFPEPTPEGYNVLTDVRHAATDKPHATTVTRQDRPVRLLAAGGTTTDVILANGFYRLGNKDEKVPAVYERRSAAKTVYGHALDISGSKEGYVKAVSQEGGLEAGYALLKVETVQGADLCFASYRSGALQAAGLEADAQQAMIRTEGNATVAMYLAGKSVKTAGGSLERSEPGLAYVEKLADGSYAVGNPSPTDATVTVTLPALGATPKTVTLQARTTAPFKP